MEEKRLDKLEKLIKLVTESLTREEFVESFGNVVRLVQEVKRSNEKEFELIHKFLELMGKKLEDENASKVSGLQEEVRKSLKSNNAKMDSAVALVEKTVRSVKDGKDADEGRVADIVLSKVLPAIPPPIVLKPEDMRDKLESLIGDERLDKSAIRGLEDISPKEGQRPVFSFGGTKNAVEYTDLSSQLNGSRKTFTVPRRRFLFLIGTQFPIIYRPEVDFTGSGTYNLTLTAQVAAPESGQTLLLFHSKL